METILLTIILFSLLGLGNGLFIYFIDFCFNEGNIFDFYYNFIVDKVSIRYPGLAKVLGMCMACFGFWLSFLLYFAYIYTMGLNLLIPFIYVLFIPYISFSMVIPVMLIYIRSNEEEEKTKNNIKKTLLND